MCWKCRGGPADSRMNGSETASEVVGGAWPAEISENQPVCTSDCGSV